MGTLTMPSQDKSVDETIAQMVSDVPMLPHIVTRLLAIIGGSEHSLQDVVKIVEADASLTARILRVANSAAFYRGIPVSTVSKAVLQLGEKMIAGIAIGSCTQSVFNKPLEGYDSGEGDLWNHSLTAAIAARETAVLASKNVSPDLAFTAGLLHDIGKSIISGFLKGTTEEMVSQCDSRKCNDFLDAESEHTGTNHAIVGYNLACHWNLPEQICSSIKYHHHPCEADDEDKELVYVVHIGDIIAMMAGPCTGADSLSYKIDEDYEDYISMDKDAIPGLLYNVQEEFSRTRTAIFAERG